jgi:hypothetical protein
MGFVAISIDKYIKNHLDSNPSENEMDLRKRLNSTLADYKNGVKCSCGNDIWVIGSASIGNSCFTCITGESQPDSDYEIDSAIVKSENKKGLRHINDIDPTKIAGFFDDDGYERNTDLLKKPGLCMTCVHDNDPNQEILCNMNRYDQRKDIGFKCFAYKKIN